MTRRFLPLAILLSLVMLVLGAGTGAAAVDNSIYADLLAKYVSDGAVDYAGFQREEDRLDAYLKVLENTDLETLTPEDTFAFYTNAYNAWTIKLILTEYPEIDSIRDIGSIFSGPWSKKIVRVDGKVITLDDVEHRILRPRFQDPRVHFAVNCASKGCPPLQPEPFRGETLNAQLDEATRAFLNDPEFNYLDGDTLYVSRIFKWFGEDFPEGVTAFFLEYAEGEFRKQLESRQDRIKVKYLDYDWSLNDR